MYFSIRCVHKEEMEGCKRDNCLHGCPTSFVASLLKDAFLTIM